MEARSVRTLDTRIACLLLIVALPIGVAFCYAATAHAEYPEKPVNLYIAFEAGSTSDIIGRAVAAGAEKYLGGRFVVENKPGGGGTVALTLLANSKPDGYTLCVAPTDSVVNTPLMQKVPFKPLKSFTPILTISATLHSGLIVQNGAPWKTLQDLIDYARKNPGKIKYSTAGVGTGMHAAMEFIANKEKIKWVHIPYKGNTAAITALLGGHVDVCSAGVGFAPFVAENKARVLVSYWKDRAPQFASVPTMRELGYDFVKETIHSLFGPANLPPGVVSKLEMAFAKAMEPPEFKALLDKLDCVAAYQPSREFKPYLEDLWVKTEKIFKEADIIKEPLTQPY